MGDLTPEQWREAIEGLEQAKASGLSFADYVLAVEAAGDQPTPEVPNE